MSRYDHLAWRRTVNQYPCPACMAGPGQWCISTSGNVKHEPHADRSRLAAAQHWQPPDEAHEESHAEPTT